jgi:hypothetical protein
MGTNGLPSGRERCDTCKGNGKVTCPDCNGKWKVTCTRCNGTGKVITGYTDEGIMHRPIYQTCPAPVWGGCNGLGYTFLCKKCNEGKVICTACQGKGWLGACPKCNGDKKVPCPRCQGGAVAAASPSPKPTIAPPPQPVAAAPGTATPAGASEAPKADPSEDPLSSLDAMAAQLRKAQPANPQLDPKQWSDMTSLQRDDALAKYRADFAQWKNRTTEYQGRKVTWKVFLNDVAPAPEGGYLVKTTSAGGFWMNWNAPASAKDQLLKMRKKDPLLVAGTIKDYHFSESAGGKIFDARSMGFEVGLSDASLLTAGAGVIKLGASSRPQ